MATISEEGRGRKRVQFFGLTGKRHTLRLGKVPLRIAQEVKLRIEYLLATERMRMPVDSDTAAWLAQIGDELHGKLAKVSLVRPRSRATLGAFLDAYIDGRLNIKPASRTNLRDNGRLLTNHFGEALDLREVDAAKAEIFKSALVAAEYAPATVGRAITRARQFFGAAVEKGILATNPFAKISAPEVANRSRMRFIDAETTGRLLAACPDDYCRAVIALVRFGGLRAPSDLLAVTWEGVDWIERTIDIPRRKTRERLIPLFADLYPHLKRIHQAGAAGPIVQARTKSHFRRMLESIVAAAGLEQWPRLWHNLRSTRQTELTDLFPAHVVSQWMGNSEAISRTHYLAANEHHYRKAAGVTQNLTHEPPRTMVGEGPEAA